MRSLRIVGLGLLVGLAFTGCQRHSYTEADVRDAIAEHQGKVQVDIERTVQAAPPVEVENPPANGTAARGSRTLPASGEGVELPPPNRYDVPRPPSRETPPQSPPATGGEIQLDPRTGQYGIRPPGAPETYIIPLNQEQSAPQ